MLGHGSRDPQWVRCPAVTVRFGRFTADGAWRFSLRHWRHAGLTPILGSIQANAPYLPSSLGTDSGLSSNLDDPKQDATWCRGGSRMTRVSGAGYDLIYRDPRLWQWALDQQRPSAVDAWKDR